LSATSPKPSLNLKKLAMTENSREPTGPGS
jgi:hypothetical protein